ncbi:MAG TPA: alpha/beta hydrolase [Dehalococcoidia bacterium]|nr:alpha/beta hydrolase [Dehalococcoidia bacterium]
MELVLVHGSGNTGTVWRHQTEHFPEADAPNLPGHLAPGSACTSVDDYARWLHSWVEAAGYSRPVIGGHSLGGAIALQYALDYPQDLGGLLLFGTGAKLRVAPHVLEALEKGTAEPGAWLRDFVEPQLRRVVGVFGDWGVRYSHIERELREQLVEEIREVGAAVQLNDFLCCDRFNVMERLHEISAPTLVLSGSEDILTPPKYGTYLAQHIPGARQLLIEGGTHYFFAEKPEETNRAIEDFLCALPVSSV